jgi:hypothetical protein
MLRVLWNEGKKLTTEQSGQDSPPTSRLVTKINNTVRYDIKEIKGAQCFTVGVNKKIKKYIIKKIKL